jgi:dihydroorotase
MPILKREEDRQALIQAAVSGNPKFFLGTDSAPHARNTKEAVCGCAGMYTAHAGIELYAEIFGANNALDKLQGFASVFGPSFYGLPLNADRITLAKELWDVPKELPFHHDALVPFRAGGTVSWRLL